MKNAYSSGFLIPSCRMGKFSTPFTSAALRTISLTCCVFGKLTDFTNLRREIVDYFGKSLWKNKNRTGNLKICDHHNFEIRKDEYWCWSGSPWWSVLLWCCKYIHTYRQSNWCEFWKQTISTLSYQTRNFRNDFTDVGIIVTTFSATENLPF